MPPQHDAAAFAARLAAASPREIVEAAVAAMPDRLAVVSSFGTESAVLLKFVADVDPSLPVLFLDTLWLFKETLAYRDALVERLKLTDVRTVTPSPSALALRDPKRELCFRDRDACCGIRKVEPLASELAAFDGWMTGRKRYHGGERASLPAVEADGPRLKFNPLARPHPRRTQSRLHRGAAAAPSVAGLGLYFGRLRALHQPPGRRRCRARRPLGRSRQDRMRHP